MTASKMPARICESIRCPSAPTVLEKLEIDMAVIVLAALVRAGLAG
jgi:hypothetical protein